MVLFLNKCLIVITEIFLKDLSLKKRDGNWIDVLAIIAKQYDNRTHSLTTLTSIPAS